MIEVLFTLKLPGFVEVFVITVSHIVANFYRKHLKLIRNFWFVLPVENDLFGGNNPPRTLRFVLIYWIFLLGALVTTISTSGEAICYLSLSVFAEVVEITVSHIFVCPDRTALVSHRFLWNRLSGKYYLQKVDNY